MHRERDTLASAVADHYSMAGRGGNIEGAANVDRLDLGQRLESGVLSALFTPQRWSMQSSSASCRGQSRRRHSCAVARFSASRGLKAFWRMGVTLCMLGSGSVIDSELLEQLVAAVRLKRNIDGRAGPAAGRGGGGKLHIQLAGPMRTPDWCTGRIPRRTPVPDACSFV